MSKPTEQQIKGKALQDRYEAETGGVAVVAVVSHGELAYASWGYQTWLEQQAAPPPQAGADMTLDEISAWCEQTFGPITMPRMIERAKEEFVELEQATDEHIAEEAADVVIVLSRVPNLWAAIQKKMEVNKGREWGLKGDGTGYHTKAQAGAEDAELHFPNQPIQWAQKRLRLQGKELDATQIELLTFALHESARHIAAKAVEDRDKELTRLVDERIDSLTKDIESAATDSLKAKLFLMRGEMEVVRFWLNPQIETT